MFSFEFAVLDWIQANLRSPIMDLLMTAITTLGNHGLVWLILAGILLLTPKHRKAVVAVLAGLALEVVCCNLVLKPLVGRIRPCDVNPAVQLLVARPDDFSFPSGHTGASFAAVSALYFSRSRLWMPSLILAVLIAFSRLYLYVHYPTDILAGALLGIMTGWAGNLVSAYANRKLRLNCCVRLPEDERVMADACWRIEKILNIRKSGILLSEGRRYAVELEMISVNK